MCLRNDNNDEISLSDLMLLFRRREVKAPKGSLRKSCGRYGLLFIYFIYLFNMPDGSIQ